MGRVGGIWLNVCDALNAVIAPRVTAPTLIENDPVSDCLCDARKIAVREVIYFAWSVRVVRMT